MQAAFIADASQWSMHDLSFDNGAGSIVAGLLEGDPFQTLAWIGAPNLPRADPEQRMDASHAPTYD